MRIVNPESSSHWYALDGTAMHEVPNKSKGGMRPTDKRDARKLKLLASVTNILSIKSESNLEAWKQTQAILASLTLPRKPDESDQSYSERVVIDMREQARSAAERGHRIHAAAERLIKTGFVDLGGELRPYVSKFHEWIGGYIERERLRARAEIRVVGYGYAGTADLILEGDTFFDVGDIKSQDWKLKEGSWTYSRYKKWIYQLVAYAQAFQRMTGKTPRRYFSLCIDKSQQLEEPDEARFASYFWTSKEIAWAQKAWPAALELWSADNEYDAREYQAEEKAA